MNVSPVCDIVEHEVALREGAPLHVLAGQPDRDAFDEERRERERLGMAPVDSAAGHRRPPALELPGELRMDRELLGCAQELLVQLLERRARHRRVDRAGARMSRRAVIDLLGLRERGLQPVVCGAQRRLDVTDETVCFLARQDAFLDELLLVELAHARMPVDLLDHERLRVRGLVLFVVSEPAIADEIDDDVLAEAAAIRHREPCSRDRRFRIVGVHVDDRAVESLREVRRVARGAAFARIGREPDLVVRDQVQRAAGR